MFGPINKPGREERGRDGAGGDAASAIGHAARQHAARPIDHILEARAKDLAARVSVAQLLVERGHLLEADGVALVVVGAGDRDGLGLYPGVEPDELARAAFDSARGLRSGRRTCGGRRAA